MSNKSDTVDSSRNRPIVFYDGDCGFCNGSVRFVLKNETTPATMFAAIQGETARELLPKSSLPPDIGEKSILLHENGQFLIRSRAAFRIMELMGGPWSTLAKGLKMIPTPLADSAYRIVARFRRNLPSGESCALLPPEQRKRFLP